MFIGEAPGAEEDRLGEPFVGRAGLLLTDMITKGMGLARDQVYIANILKCRPPENRNPTSEESDNCSPYLEEQIAILRPEFICLLGRVALSVLLRTTISMNKCAANGSSTAASPPSSPTTRHICFESRNSRRRRGKICRCS